MQLRRLALGSASKNGFAKLDKAGAASVTASDGAISTPAALALTVSAATATRVAVSELAASAGAVGSPCLFTCTVTTLGNSGTIKAKPPYRRQRQHRPQRRPGQIGHRHRYHGRRDRRVAAEHPASGAALSSTQFTYTAPASGSFTHTITLASTGYTSATVSAGK